MAILCDVGIVAILKAGYRITPLPEAKSIRVSPCFLNPYGCGFVSTIWQRRRVKPFNESVFERPSGEEIAGRAVMTNVVTAQVRIYIQIELLEIGGENVAHVDDGVRLVFKPVNETLVESRFAIQIVGNILPAERKNHY